MSNSTWKEVLYHLYTQLVNEPSQNEQNVSLPATQNVDKATPFYIEDDSEKVYLDADHPDVVTICFLAWEFANLINNRDYKSLDGSVEYHLYTEKHRKELFNKKDPKKTTDSINKYKIKSYCDGIQIISAQFNQELTLSEVIYGVRITVTDATDKYFKFLNEHNQGKSIAKNITYLQLYKLELVKEDGMWKVDNFLADDKLTIPPD